MLPKFQAAVDFVDEREGRTALITSYDKINDALKGKTGDEREGRTALITSYDKINDALKGKTGTIIHA